VREIVYEQQQVQCQRTEYETVYEDRPMTCYRNVTERKVRECQYQVSRPVYECAEREERYTVCRPVWETSYRDCSYTVRKPIWETATRECRRTVQRPVIETSERMPSHRGPAGYGNRQSGTLLHGHATGHLLPYSSTRLRLLDDAADLLSRPQSAPLLHRQLRLPALDDGTDAWVHGESPGLLL